MDFLEHDHADPPDLGDAIDWMADNDDAVISPLGLVLKGYRESRSISREFNRYAHLFRDFHDLFAKRWAEAEAEAEALDRKGR